MSPETRTRSDRGRHPQSQPSHEAEHLRPRREAVRASRNESHESRDEVSNADPRTRELSLATASVPCTLSVRKRPKHTPPRQRSVPSFPILSSPKTPEEIAQDTSLYINTQLEK
ncbi:hypothetical protein J3458_014408 [Metarhizium acridum]|uniref:uncharacterized protein n=1 Tax=Metarhizium acridum TaxID=92637 RepID=UPI001C6AA274|nr:hypothetical protein J3458_014408 [Metarhizium acridum]